MPQTIFECVRFSRIRFYTNFALVSALGVGFGFGFVFVIFSAGQSEVCPVEQPWSILQRFLCKFSVDFQFFVCNETTPMMMTMMMMLAGLLECGCSGLLGN